jgi:hypothetical protein
MSTHNSTKNQKSKPHEQMPEHHSTDKQPVTKEEKIDAQMEDSFPASDPPSFSGGNHIIANPPPLTRPKWWRRKRKSKQATPRKPPPTDFIVQGSVGSAQSAAIF